MYIRYNVLRRRAVTAGQATKTSVVRLVFTREGCLSLDVLRENCSLTNDARFFSSLRT